MIVNTARRHSKSGEVLNDLDDHLILRFKEERREVEIYRHAIEISNEVVNLFKEERPRTRQKSLDIIRDVLIILITRPSKAISISSITSMSGASASILFRHVRDRFPHFLFFRSGFAITEGARPAVIGMDNIFSMVLLEQWERQGGNIDLDTFDPCDYIKERFKKKSKGNPEGETEYDD